MASLRKLDKRLNKIECEIKEAALPVNKQIVIQTLRSLAENLVLDSSWSGEISVEQNTMPIRIGFSGGEIFDAFVSNNINIRINNYRSMINFRPADSLL